MKAAGALIVDQVGEQASAVPAVPAVVKLPQGGETVKVTRGFGDRAFKPKPQAVEGGSASAGSTEGQASGTAPAAPAAPAAPVAKAATAAAATAGAGTTGKTDGKEKGPTVSLASPDVSLVNLGRGHKFMVLVSSEVARALGGDAAVSEVPRRRAGRPRLACGELVQTARAKGAVGSLTALCVFFDWRPEEFGPSPDDGKKGPAAEETPPTKKARTAATLPPGAPKQVRCRQILVKHRDVKDPVDRVRGNRLVTRSMAEAEQILRETIEAIEGSPQRSIFTLRCKEVSECAHCLKGGEMAGDMGWSSRGQLSPAVEAVSFALPAGHMSDIVEDEEGVRILWRIA